MIPKAGAGCTSPCFNKITEISELRPPFSLSRAFGASALGGPVCSPPANPCQKNFLCVLCASARSIPLVFSNCAQPLSSRQARQDRREILFFPAKRGAAFAARKKRVFPLRALRRCASYGFGFFEPPHPLFSRKDAESAKKCFFPRRAWGRAEREFTSANCRGPSVRPPWANPCQKNFLCVPCVSARCISFFDCQGQGRVNVSLLK